MLCYGMLYYVMLCYVMVCYELSLDVGLQQRHRYTQVFPFETAIFGPSKWPV